MRQRGDITRRLVLILTTVGTLAGCASHRVEQTEPVRGSGLSRIEPVQRAVDEDESRRGRRKGMVIPPRLVQQALPRYPDVAIDDGVSCVARILYHVETTGDAKLVRLNWERPPPLDHLEAFETAIKSAIADWSFRPAVRLDQAEREDGWKEPTEVPIPQAQYALIHFRVENGAPVVD